MKIKPITVTLLAYGTKANIAAIRKAATAQIEDDHDQADPSLFLERPAEDIHADIEAARWDPTAVLKKPGPSQAGLQVTMPDMHERMTTAWLNELKVARTCVVFASWFSEAEQERCQMLCAEGEHWMDRR